MAKILRINDASLQPCCEDRVSNPTLQVYLGVGGVIVYCGMERSWCRQMDGLCQIVQFSININVCCDGF